MNNLQNAWLALITSLSISWCGTVPESPHKPFSPTPGPELVKISSISPAEFKTVWGIMTFHRRIDNILWGICHFSKVNIPSTPWLRADYKSRTWADWYKTGGDVYTLTAKHCLDTSMTAMDAKKEIDIVAIRSLSRLTASWPTIIKSIDTPPVLERSDYDEVSIENKPVTLRACVPHRKNNTAHCIKMEWRTYPTWLYGQRAMYFSIKDILPILKSAWRSCEIDDGLSWISGMVITDTSNRAYAVVSTWSSICTIATLGATNGAMNIEPLRNTGNSLPWESWRTAIIAN